MGEIAAVDQVNAERVQEAGGNRAELDGGSGIERLSAEGLETIAAMSTVERKRIGNSGAGDTGNGRDTALKFREELHGALGRVAVQARIDGHSEDAGGAEADTNVERRSAGCAGRVP